MHILNKKTQNNAFTTKNCCYKMRQADLSISNGLISVIFLCLPIENMAHDK